MLCSAKRLMRSKHFLGEREGGRGRGREKR